MKIIPARELLLKKLLRIRSAVNEGSIIINTTTNTESCIFIKHSSRHNKVKIRYHLLLSW